MTCCVSCVRAHWDTQVLGIRGSTAKFAVAARLSYVSRGVSHERCVMQDLEEPSSAAATAAIDSRPARTAPAPAAKGDATNSAHFTSDSGSRRTQLVMMHPHHDNSRDTFGASAVNVNTSGNMASSMPAAARPAADEAAKAAAVALLGARDKSLGIAGA
jgi:hypothetical protein